MPGRVGQRDCLRTCDKIHCQLSRLRAVLKLSSKKDRCQAASVLMVLDGPGDVMDVTIWNSLRLPRYAAA